MAEQQTLADLKNVIEGTVPAEGGAAATEAKSQSMAVTKKFTLHAQCYA